MVTIFWNYLTECKVIFTLHRTALSALSPARNHTRWDSCSQTRTVISARFLRRSEAGPCQSQKCSFTSGSATYWCRVNRYSDIGSGGGMEERGLESTDTHGRKYLGARSGIKFTKPSRPTAPAWLRHNVRYASTTCSSPGSLRCCSHYGW